MSSIITPISAVVNVLISKYIDTKDRVLDQSLISLCTILVSFLLTFFLSDIPKNYKSYYNRIIYKLWNVKFDKIEDISHMPFWFDKPEDINDKNFFCGDQTIIFTKIKSRQYVPIFVLSNGHVFYAKLNQKGTKIAGSTEYYSKGFNIITSLEDTKIQTNIPELLSWNYNSNCETKIGNISPKKNFDTLFFDDKEKLINMINKFKDGKMYPECISMDNKLGILLYGPPGTGKTGTISAIANMLNRSALTIDCSAITTCLMFDSIFTYAKNKNPQPIIVLDEIDCILDVIFNPKNESANIETNEKWAELLAISEGDERKEIINMIREAKQTKNKPLNLGYILSKLDGLEDNNGRLIIATTNNPEKLNPALLRPGRFDMKLCLSHCSNQMLLDILGRFFSCNQEELDIIKNYGITEFKHSPLNVINTALIHNNLMDTLKALK